MYAHTCEVVQCYTSDQLGRNQSGKLGQGRGGEEREMQEVSEEQAFVPHRVDTERCINKMPLASPQGAENTPGPSLPVMHEHM